MALTGRYGRQIRRGKKPTSYRGRRWTAPGSLSANINPTDELGTSRTAPECFPLAFQDARAIGCMARDLMQPNLRTTIALLGVLLGCCTLRDAQVAPDAPATIVDGSDDGPIPISHRVLFVGNSYTYVNDLPAVVQALAAATPGYAFEVESVTPGGARLADHWSTTGARTLIESGNFDVVVLQGQSLEPLMQTENFDEHATLLADATHAATARGVWFATWARRAGDPVYANLGLVDPESMTTNLELRYEAAAALHEDAVARVGAAWQLALTTLPEVVLHSDDGSHPTAAGTLLAACVMFQSITGTAPRLPSAPPLGIPTTTAEALCALATSPISQGTAIPR